MYTMNFHKNAYSNLKIFFKHNFPYINWALLSHHNLIAQSQRGSSFTTSVFVKSVEPRRNISLFKTSKQQDTQ